MESMLEPCELPVIQPENLSRSLSATITRLPGRYDFKMAVQRTLFKGCGIEDGRALR